MSKGQVNLIEYVLTVLFGVILLVVVTALFYGFYSTVVRSDIENELKELSFQTAENIVKLYKYAKDSKVEPSNLSSVLVGGVDLNLPSQVGRRNYEIVLVSTSPIWANLINFSLENKTINIITKTSGAKVVARTTQEPFVTVEHDIPNIDVDVQGRSENGVESKLRYYRYNFNNVLYDKIILGDSDILISITDIS